MAKEYKNALEKGLYFICKKKGHCANQCPQQKNKAMEGPRMIRIKSPRIRILDLCVGLVLDMIGERRTSK